MTGPYDPADDLVPDPWKKFNGTSYLPEWINEETDSRVRVQKSNNPDKPHRIQLLGPTGMVKETVAEEWGDGQAKRKAREWMEENPDA